MKTGASATATWKAALERQLLDPAPVWSTSTLRQTRAQEAFGRVDPRSAWWSPLLRNCLSSVALQLVVSLCFVKCVLSERHGRCGMTEGRTPSSTGEPTTSAMLCWRHFEARKTFSIRCPNRVVVLISECAHRRLIVECFTG